jgi:hypothetical protein
VSRSNFLGYEAGVPHTSHIEGSCYCLVVERKTFQVSYVSFVREGLCLHHPEHSAIVAAAQCQAIYLRNNHGQRREGIQMLATRLASRPLINIRVNPTDNFCMTEPEGCHFYTGRRSLATKVYLRQKGGGGGLDILHVYCFTRKDRFLLAASKFIEWN